MRCFPARASLLAVLVLTLPTRDAAAQGTPDGWRWVADSAAMPSPRPDTVLPGTFAFVAMAPGWHITMGPGALLYAPVHRAAGRFEVSSQLILFPGTAPSGYGVFLGGENLETATRSWTAFIVRRDGMAAVLRHENGATRELLAWRPASGVRAQAGRNIVRVAVDTAVHFVVNDSVVAVLPSATTPTAGVYGFRIGAGLNMHVTSLDATLRHAPVPESE